MGEDRGRISLRGAEQAARGERSELERLGRITADETALWVERGGPRLVIHVVPLAGNDVRVDVAALKDIPQRCRHPSTLAL